MSKIDFFRAHHAAIKAIRATPQTIPVITTAPGLQVWINRCDPTLSFKDVSCRSGKTAKAGSIQIDLLVCFKVGGSVTTMNINPLVSGDGSVDINYFRAEYLRIVNSGALPKELKTHLNSSPRHFHDIFNAYASATRMIIATVDMDYPFQQDTHYAYA